MEKNGESFKDGTSSLNIFSRSHFQRQPQKQEQKLTKRQTFDVNSMFKSENQMFQGKKMSEFGINGGRKESLFDMEGYIMQNKKKVDLKKIQYKAKVQNTLRDKNIKVK